MYIDVFCICYFSSLVAVMLTFLHKFSIIQILFEEDNKQLQVPFMPHYFIKLCFSNIKQKQFNLNLILKDTEF